MRLQLARRVTRHDHGLFVALICRLHTGLSGQVRGTQVAGDQQCVLGGRLEERRQLEKRSVHAKTSLSHCCAQNTLQTVSTSWS